MGLLAAVLASPFLVYLGLDLNKFVGMLQKIHSKAGNRVNAFAVAVIMDNILLTCK